jgi:hypothetical protein
VIRRLGLLLVPLLLLPAPAYAGTWSAPDPRGDATVSTFDPEPEPCGTYTEERTDQGDLRRISVRHTRERVVMTMRVSGLRSRYDTWTYFTLVTPDRALDVSLARYDGRAHVDISRHPDLDPEDFDDSECGIVAWARGVRECPTTRSRIDVDRGLVRVDLARRCVGNPRWVRVGGSVVTGRERWSWDAWTPRGHDGDFLDPVVGPRVHAPR